MTDLRKAAEMALEALRKMTPWLHPEEKAIMKNVIEALRQALAQPEQEPVLWKWSGDGWSYEKPIFPATPLYTAPPSKPWVSLTVDEIWGWFESNTAITRDGAFRIARAIEAKLKEKNT